MRNGNNDIKKGIAEVRYGSYRTYEEWKPEKMQEILEKLFGSYRTYEEWKQSTKQPETHKARKFLPYL